MFRTYGVTETFAFGERLGALLRAGDVLALSGELGAGKTQLVCGIAASYLGSGTHVSSPSFTLINRYERAQRRIHHLDLYRLSSLEELESAGYWDAVEDPGALVLIEWLEQVHKAQPLEFTQIWIDYLYENDVPVEGERQFRLLEGSNKGLYQRLLPLFT